MKNKLIRLGIIIGGKSVEHEISLISGLQSQNNIDLTKYHTIIFYLDKNNHIYVDDAFKDIETFKDQKKYQQLIKNKEVFLKNENNQTYYIYYNKPKEKHIVDIFLPVVHGYGVEDGTISAYLDMYNAIYTQSDTIPSAIIQDKVATKAMLKLGNFPVLEGFVATSNEQISIPSYPVIIKPAYLGSSIGIKVVKEKNKLQEAVDEAFLYSDKILIEKALTKFKEYNCAVIKDHNRIKTSVIEEINHKEDILTYDEKYLESDGKLSEIKGRIIPANITKTLESKIKELSKEVYEWFSLNGVVRIDFLYDEETSNIYINEINNIPGSLAFYLFEPLNISYKQLLDILITNAIISKQNKNQKISTFNSNILNSKSIKLNK